MSSTPDEAFAGSSPDDDTHRSDDYLNYRIKVWLKNNGLGNFTEDEEKFKIVKELIMKFNVDLNSEDNTSFKKLVKLADTKTREEKDEEKRKAHKTLYRDEDNPTEDPSTFAKKKSLMAGFLDLSLLFANGVHIRDMADRGDKEWYIWVNIVLVIVIILLQVSMAFMLAYVYATNLYKIPLRMDEKERRRCAIRVNTGVLFITLLITIIHVIAISLFWKERESGTDISEVIHLLKQYQNNTYG